jgi:hypothetical protein
VSGIHDGTTSQVYTDTGKQKLSSFMLMYTVDPFRVKVYGSRNLVQAIVVDLTDTDLKIAFSMLVENHLLKRAKAYDRSTYKTTLRVVAT